VLNLTLTEKASFVALAAAFILVCVPFGLSFARNEPFIIYGKEFGFGMGDYKKAQNDLAACQQRLDKAAVDAFALSERLNSLVTQEESRKQKSAKMWFPVDDVTFYNDGKLITQEGAERKGTWSHRESELTLRLVAMDEDGIVLATNLAAPGNMIRIPNLNSVLVPMMKWDYRLSFKSIDPDTAEVRIERQQKS
jgi:hypothetical protein